MGCFSFMYADIDNEIPLTIGCSAYCPIPKKFRENGNRTIFEKSYDGYGMFGGEDVYELVADWNREFLTKNPDYIIPVLNKKVSEMRWYEPYSNLSKTHKDIEEYMEKHYPGCFFEYRHIGVEIAAYDECNEKLLFPIKIALHDVDYNTAIASKNDPNQGFVKEFTPQLAAKVLNGVIDHPLICQDDILRTTLFQLLLSAEAYS